MENPYKVYSRILRRERSLSRLGFDDIVVPSNPFRQLSRRVFIAASARTGSHWLAEGLRDFGVYADEHFNPDIVRRCVEATGISTLAAYCEHLVRDCAPNGVFAVKGPTHMLYPLILAGELPDFAADWRFVHLRRENEVRQAASWSIGESTGRWRSYDDVSEGVTSLEFDAGRIAHLLELQRGVNAEWEAIFRVFQIEPIRVTYEQLEADRDRTLARVADFLDVRGLPRVPPSFDRPALKRQATSLNDEWEARFRSDPLWRTL